MYNIGKIKKKLLIISLACVMCLSACGTAKAAEAGVNTETESTTETVDNKDTQTSETIVEGTENFVVEVENTYPDVPYTTKMIVTLENGSVLQEVYDLGDEYGGWIGNVQTVDLTGDGTDEIVLCLEVVGSNYGASYVYVYQLIEGELHTLLELNDEKVSEITDKISTCSTVEVVDGKLIVEGKTGAAQYDKITIVFNNDGTWSVKED